MGWRDRILLTGISAAYVASLAPAWRRFLRTAATPWATQAQRLRELLTLHAGTRYGTEHGFAEIRDVRQFQDQVPIADYESLRSYVERAADGEPNVLSAEPVLAFERSSGTTGGNKLIPITRTFLEELSRATSPWLHRMYRTRPSLLGTTAYWSISPAARDREQTSGGISIGFDDDTEYFGPAARWALNRMMAVPASVAQIPDVETWRDRTADLLAHDGSLGMISVWSPTFLTLLMDRIDRRHPNVTWPRLRLISCWTEGHAQRFVAPIRARFPGVEIEGKGLLATEGVVTIPVGPGCAVAPASHFFEFIDLHRPGARPRLIHELTIGGRYAPLLTTGAGFTRYRLLDEVECTGFFLQTPLLRFVGKLDRVSDLCGEKITAAEVDRAVARTKLTFALVAPSDGPPPYYILFAEGDDPDRAAQILERSLLENHHYRYCRDLGQLGPVQAVAVQRGRETFERVMIARGIKAGDIKPSHLDTELGWRYEFER